MATHVLFVARGKFPAYLLGEDGSDLVRVFRPVNGSVGEPVAMASLSAHMPHTDFEEYEGSAEEEKAILEQARQATEARQKQADEYLAKKGARAKGEES